MGKSLTKNVASSSKITFFFKLQENDEWNRPMRLPPHHARPWAREQKSVSASVLQALPVAPAEEPTRLGASRTVNAEEEATQSEKNDAEKGQKY